MIKVPFPVTSKKLELPIIGYNVIELIVKDDSKSNESLAESMRKDFRNSFPDSIPALINFIQTSQTSFVH